MTAAQTKFISEIAALVQKYAPQYEIKCYSAIIAQAINESNWGISSLASKYYNYFGLKCGSSWKGKSVNLSTKEEYVAGTLTAIKDNFRVFDSIEEGVKGYFDFIDTSRYANLKGITESKQYLENIKADGYATSSSYVDNVYKLVTTYNLVQYDLQETVQAASIPVINKGIEKGSKVKVINAITYDGKSFKSYYPSYDVIQVSGDRVVIGQGTIVTAAVNIGNIELAESISSQPASVLGAGSRIKIKSGSSQHGKSEGFAGFVYNTVYTVISISGDRVVFGLNGAVTGAVHKDNCIVQ